MFRRLRIFVLASFTLIGAGAPAPAQVFQSRPAQIPGDSTSNTGYTEAVDFADVDLDGDLDCVKAEGGDAGTQRNRLWLNRGGLQGGVTGFFQDFTGARFPNIADASRDMDFVDIDGDGDHDLYISNTSAVANQPNRWWINMGGAQGGTAGFFQDQSAARWVNIAVNDGVSTFSSIPLSLKIPAGFIDWSCDCVFGDLDDDGDPDLYHSTYGSGFGGTAPSRLFLNDGAGFFEEHNPSGVQLATSVIPNGTAALWCEGVQQHNTLDSTGVQADIADDPLGVELGDLDGDFDVDALQGARTQLPRLYRNLAQEQGGFGWFRDVTGVSFAQFADSFGNYEQELGDFDNDDDLDLYALNWPNIFEDAVARNDGAGHFGAFTALANSSDDDNEADWFDADGDGTLDAFVANFTGSNRLYLNSGAGGGYALANASATHLPIDADRSLAADSADVDDDGDSDLMIANDENQPERLYVNTSNVADAHAPRIPLVEQAPNRVAGSAPTVVRAHVYDNCSWDVLRYHAVTLEHSWNGGADWQGAPMTYSGGQVFRGEIRGDLAGAVLYRVRAIDRGGNVGVSATLGYSASGCTGNVTVYCTSAATSSGCIPSISASGAPTVSNPSGFVIRASSVDAQRFGLVFYGLSGAAISPWGAGPSFLCVKSPTQRGPVVSSGGNAGACDGEIALDWLAFVAQHPAALGAPFTGGEIVHAQAWIRDPGSSKTTALSNALVFVACP